MSPIIDIQRRLVEVGRIRMGTTEEKQKRDGGTFRMPVRLSTWRLTSRDEQRLAHAAERFGGQVVPWAQREGEYELITDTDALPIMVMPGQNLSSWYELWGQRAKKKPIECFRRCDGVTETITDAPCLCDPENRECKPTTRLSVLLPDVPGLGCWRFDSHGYYAAVELAGTADLLDALTRSGQLVPARLRIDQRRQVKDGETTTFPVPVIDIDVRLPDVLGIAALGPGSAPARELEQPEYKALPAATGGVSVRAGLEAAARQAEPKATTARSAAPIGPEADFTQPDPVPVPDEDGTLPEPPAAPAPAPAATEDGEKRTGPQTRKLNVLVGKLRDAGHITTEQLYAAMARARQVDAETMVELLAGARDDQGQLHWSPLRDSLTKAEASDLIERLGRLEENVAATVPA